MTMEIGLVGLPNVGKSTLFNALTHAGALVASYPFTTIEPNVGVIAVPDPRLQVLGELIQPEELVPTTLRVVDIAGLVKGASQGEGLGNQFLGHIRNVDAIAMVVRCFEDDEIPHVTAELDPAGDIETIELELALADLATVERRLERAHTQAKGNPAAYAHEIAALESIKRRLEAGQPLRGASIPEDEAPLAQEMQLLTAKPRMYIANVSEGDLPAGGPLVEPVARIAAAEGASLAVVCAAIEAELVDSWDAEEAAAYLRELGLESSCLGRLVREGYRLLDLITFFTTVGAKIVRAWTLRRGQTVLEAAGKIHSDMQRGFIRAEVMAYDDLARLRSVAAARDHGLLRVEGRDYLVQDGDVLHIRFNV
ncbi:MAG: redox-regulated ATPase YchF [Chloroflexi bacterium]|nr:redox-regulated ATPase YchF [Chloroflexota bacterium]